MGGGRGAGRNKERGYHLGLGPSGEVWGPKRDRRPLSEPPPGTWPPCPLLPLQARPALQVFHEDSFLVNEDKGLCGHYSRNGVRTGRGRGRGHRAQLELVQELPRAQPSWWQSLQAAPDGRSDSLKASPCHPHMLITLW